MAHAGNTRVDLPLASDICADLLFGDVKPLCKGFCGDAALGQALYHAGFTYEYIVLGRGDHLRVDVVCMLIQEKLLFLFLD